jgi:3-oxoacyl-[acyl-carrier-protein] synthase II
MTRRRVVVTGVGVITPVGTTVPDMWDSLVAGRSGVDHITRIDASTFPTTFGAEVHEVDESRYPADPRLRTVLDRKNLFGWIAADDALKDAGILASRPARFGVSLGTESRRPDFLSRLADGALYPNSHDHLRFSPFVMAGELASHHGFTGPQMTVSTACTSSTQAMGIAYQKIQWDQADAMLTGGCDSLIDPLMLTGFSLLGALSKRNDDPAHASRPFDLHRDGFVLGEGAGMLVFEELGHAQARGAQIYGEVLGYASTSNAFRLTDSPADGQGAYLAMRNALADARVSPADIGYINAHGTSTHQNDRSETAAIKRCFGEQAPHVPISSTKSMMGHLVNAGGAVELIVCLLTINHGVITPTINYEVPDPECDLDYVPNVSRAQRVDRALSNSFGFGGVNATVVVGRVGRVGLTEGA